MRPPQLLPLLLTLISLPVATAAQIPPIPAGEHAHGALLPHEGFTLALSQGTDQDCGTAFGSLVGPQLQLLLPPMYQLMAASSDPAAIRRRWKGLPDHHRRELQAVARSAKVDEEQLIAVNLHVDFACTAVVAGLAAGDEVPTRMARNMDYAPREILGPLTLVHTVRQTGHHAFTSITWPGYTGVVSGMNEHGLCVAILVNYGNRSYDDGLATPFMTRVLLEECSSVAEAWTLFSERLPAAGHFIAICDTTDAAVFWREDDQAKRRRPVDHCLTCANERPDRAGRQHSARIRRLGELQTGDRFQDAAALRSALTSVHHIDTNAQAMLFEPQRLGLELATATARTAAADGPWQRIAIADLLRGTVETLAQVQVEALGRAEGLRHYDTKP